jgi:hypothetical protein
MRRDENSHEGLDRLTVKLRELDHLGELSQVFGPHKDGQAVLVGISNGHP